MPCGDVSVALLWGLLLEAVNVSSQMSSLVPISVNLDYPQTLKRMHTHTQARAQHHTLTQQQPAAAAAASKDAPGDRMQPVGERKWLYPPK